MIKYLALLAIFYVILYVIFVYIIPYIETKISNWRKQKRE